MRVIPFFKVIINLILLKVRLITALHRLEIPFKSCFVWSNFWKHFWQADQWIVSAFSWNFKEYNFHYLVFLLACIYIQFSQKPEDDITMPRIVASIVWVCYMDAGTDLGFSAENNEHSNPWAIPLAPKCTFFLALMRWRRVTHDLLGWSNLLTKASMGLMTVFFIHCLSPVFLVV